MSGSRQVYDAIVIGTGITGGWAAKELTQAGLEVLVLEAGPAVVPDRDYGEHIPVHEMKFRGMRDRRKQSINQPVQKECYACDEVAEKFFVDDLENPYTTAEGKPFLWIRGRQVGGKSIMWARQSYRLSDLDFEANARDGFGADWPIRYADLEPWYDYVEGFAGISGQAEGLPHLPDGNFLPPMEMSCVEAHVRDSLATTWGGERTMTIGRTAVLTQPHNGRQACHYCGPCERGCIPRSYFSSLNATLPVAAATGRMTLRPDSVVRSLLYEDGRTTGALVIDRESHEAIEFSARMVFLCASALESTRILLNSSNEEYTDGLANSSGALGHYLMDHAMDAGARATFEGWEDRTTFGRRPNGVYVARFRNVTDQHPDFLRGYGYQGSARREGWQRGITGGGFGADFKQRMAEPGPWTMWLGAFGECLPRYENYVELDPEVVDAWGIPVLKMHIAWSDNERTMMNDGAIQAAEMLEAAGGKVTELVTSENLPPPGLTIHEMGTARMGRDPATSVLNGFNQSHDIPNLFLVDGASMASSACQNPSLTYMALTARACAYAVEELRRGEL